MLDFRDATDRASDLRALFEAAGGVPVETGILQPAETLLDLYGEDIRARAYVTSDAVRGEQMLRPDFTVPVVQMHMAGGAEPARYTYAGRVFRRQEDDEDRSNEYLQVGYEVFDRSNVAEADAEVFGLIDQAVAGLNLTASTGDIGILMAAVEAIDTSARRKAALLRHIWRPRRFRALLERFSGSLPVPETRAALLASSDPFAGAAPQIGLRSRAEVEARIEALHEDARTAPIETEAVRLIEAVLAVREKLPFALERLRDIAVDLPAISSAVENMGDRIAALEARGVKTAALDFEGSYGRTSMEYYDGFVFGFSCRDRLDLPPIATGGRYDALTRRLGNGTEIPAVGAVIRPDLLMQVEGAQ